MGCALGWENGWWGIVGVGTASGIRESGHQEGCPDELGGALCPANKAGIAFVGRIFWPLRS